MSSGLVNANPNTSHSSVNASLTDGFTRENQHGQTTLSFRLNGKLISIADVLPQTTLLDFIRDRGLTGAKEGCAEGECGACNVVCVQKRTDGQPGSIFRAVNSCLMFLPMAHGQEIYTVEALAQKDELTLVQKELAERGGSQCGYCTPGFVMSLFAEYYRPGRTGPCDPHAMGGNLCRCTGYRPIRDAALALGPISTAANPHDEFLKRLESPPPEVSRFTSRHFFRPTTVEECFDAARKAPVTYIAGGTDLAVESNLRFRRWDRIVSLEAIEELREFVDTPDFVRIGAALSLTELGEMWTAAPPAFREWLTLFASPTLRNRATLGGSLATASPIGDSAPLLLALDAMVLLASPNGRRTVALNRFFTGFRKTVLEPGELIVSIEIPKPLPAILRFYKIAKRQMDDISTVAATFALNLDDARCASKVRLAFGGVAATPIRATAVEHVIDGNKWNRKTVEHAQALLADSLRPISDHRGSAEYRSLVSQSLLEKFWTETQEAAL